MNILTRISQVGQDFMHDRLLWLLTPREAEETIQRHLTEGCQRCGQLFGHIYK